ncbi:hypothetical protein ABEF91_008336 [Exophiala dermatitidis]
MHESLQLARVHPQTTWSLGKSITFPSLSASFNTSPPNTIARARIGEAVPPSRPEADNGRPLGVPIMSANTASLIHTSSVGVAFPKDTDRDGPRPTKRRKGGKIYHCDQRRPTCYNCERSRQYICDGYSHEDGQNVGNPADARPRRPGNASLSSDSSSPGQERKSSEQTEVIPRDAVHQTSLGYNLNQPLEWSERSPSPLSEDNTGFLAYLQHAFPDGTNEFDLPLDHNEDISLWSPSLGQQGNDLYSQAFPVVRAELPRHTLEELTQEQPAITSQQEQETCPSPPRGLSLEFHGFSHETRQLLHHYRTHVCQLMMPTEAPSHNPWLQLYLPIAVQEPTSAAKQALLHSILAVSAFNQAGLRRSKGQPFRAQATEHSKKAARLLCSGDFTAEQSRGNEVDSTNKKALLAAALTMTTIEVFSGAQDGRWHEYLRTAKDIIERTGGSQWWLSEPARATLLQIFRCLRIVSETSGWTDRKERTQGPKRSSDDPNSKPEEPVAPSPYEYTLDVSFGISMKTLWCLNKIVDLAAIKAAAAPGDCWWKDHSSDLCKLEKELFDLMEDPYAFADDESVVIPQSTDDQTSYGGQNTPGKSPQDRFQPFTFGVPQVVSEEIRENHLWAFHYSVALFYRRAICGGGNNTTSPVATDSTAHCPSGQHLVSKVLDHLENIDALTVGTPVANTLWPGFIAAVEAVNTELRHRVLVWFARAQRHGIGNIAAAKSLVLEVWRRLDRQTYYNHDRNESPTELGSVDWRDVMREKGMYIMLT